MVLVLRSYSRNYCCAWLLNALDNLASNGKTPAMFREREIWVSRSKELPLTQPSSLSLHLIRKCGPVPAGSAQSGLGEWAASLSRTSRELGKGPGPPGRSQSRPRGSKGPGPARPRPRRTGRAWGPPCCLDVSGLLLHPPLSATLHPHFLPAGILPSSLRPRGTVKKQTPVPDVQ